MAAEFTEISLEDMEKFLKRGFRALRPKQGTQNREVYFDLLLSQDVHIRVWTSITGRGIGADKGEDAIRIQLVSKAGRPLMKGKAPIVKRTQGWKTNLQDRIEDLIETYEDKDEYWEGRAGGGHSEAQPEKKPEWDSIEKFKQVYRDQGKSEAEINKILRDEMGVIRDEHNVNEDRRPPPQPERTMEPPSAGPPHRAPSTNTARATFTKLKTGDWGVRVEGDAVNGDRVRTTKRDGSSQWVTIETVVWRGKDPHTGVTVSLGTIAKSNRNAASEEDDDHEYSE